MVMIRMSCLFALSVEEMLNVDEGIFCESYGERGDHFENR